MATIVRDKIIGFEIVYNDEERRFDLHSVLENDDPPKNSRVSVYVPVNMPAYEVYWQTFNDLIDLGTEFDVELEDYRPEE
jgi:hypothetical protein